MHVRRSDAFLLLALTIAMVACAPKPAVSPVDEITTDASQPTLLTCSVSTPVPRDASGAPRTSPVRLHFIVLSDFAAMRIAAG